MRTPDDATPNTDPSRPILVQRRVMADEYEQAHHHDREASGHDDFIDRIADFDHASVPERLVREHGFRPHAL
ncbi:hypothetical protein [Lysobacter sp. HA18]